MREVSPALSMSSTGRKRPEHPPAPDSSGGRPKANLGQWPVAPGALYLIWYTVSVQTKPILEVRFYRAASGREPVREWLKALSKEERQVIGEDLKTVQFGWPLGMPLVRKMQPGLWEVRVAIPSGIVRVLFTTQGPLMVLLHGFIKKSRKTPKDDLALAVRRLKEVNDG